MYTEHQDYVYIGSNGAIKLVAAVNCFLVPLDQHSKCPAISTSPILDDFLFML